VDVYLETISWRLMMLEAISDSQGDVMTAYVIDETSGFIKKPTRTRGNPIMIDRSRL